MGQTIRLIVNADDYGLTAGVSAGIREAHQSGIVTSTTAMMNMPGVGGDLRLALGTCARLGLGAHLVLTAGGPLRPAGEVRSLVTPSGAFFPRTELPARLEAIKPAELHDEWRAQIEAFATAVGRPPDHLDSHHHSSYFSLLLLETMLDLAAEYRCAIRNPLPRSTEWGQLDAALPPSVGERLADNGPRRLAGRSAPRPDYFVSGFYGPSATLAGLLVILHGLTPGMAELMCHPGRSDATLTAVSSYHGQRDKEVEILTHPAVRTALAELNVTLATFGELEDHQGEP